MIKGSLVALVTPMQADGSVDKKSLHDLVEWHLAAKTEGLIVVGSTGEAATLNEEEQYSIIAEVVKQVGNRLPVIAGSGSSSTHHTIEMTRRAKKAGAHAALIVTPYYNKPTQNGLFAHYQAVTKAVDIPIILYNVPGRTACDLLPETVERLARLRGIIGIKEATGKIERVAEIIKRCGKKFAVYSGDDETGLESMLHDASGVISVTGNVVPQQMRAMCEAALSGKAELARELNHPLKLLHKRLFMEANPIPVKWVLNQMGLIPPGIRLPLTPLDSKFHSEVKEAMREAGII